MLNINLEDFEDGSIIYDPIKNIDMIVYCDLYSHKKELKPLNTDSIWSHEFSHIENINIPDPDFIRIFFEEYNEITTPEDKLQIAAEFWKTYNISECK